MPTLNVFCRGLSGTGWFVFFISNEDSIWTPRKYDNLYPRLSETKLRFQLHRHISGIKFSWSLHLFDCFSGSITVCSILEITMSYTYSKPEYEIATKNVYIRRRRSNILAYVSIFTVNLNAIKKIMTSKPFVRKLWSVGPQLHIIDTTNLNYPTYFITIIYITIRLNDNIASVKFWQFPVRLYLYDLLRVCSVLLSMYIHLPDCVGPTSLHIQIRLAFWIYGKDTYEYL